MRATYPFLFEDGGALSKIAALESLLHMHVFVCASECEFRGQNSVKGGRI